MKKKKDQSFDDLKSQILKPLKDMVNLFKDYLSDRQNFWQTQSTQDLVVLQDQFYPHPKLLSYLKEKRVQQVNKEYKASCERLKDLCDKLSKKYGQLSSSLRGLQS
jgi:hypothetical protein